MTAKWLSSQFLTLYLIILSHRLAFKLAYDQAVLGEASDLEELSEYLEEYESDWYFGSEKDKGWTEAIKQERTHLFSLIHDTSEVREALQTTLHGHWTCKIGWNYEFDSMKKSNWNQS